MPQNAGANSAAHVSQTIVDPEQNRYVFDVHLNLNLDSDNKS